VGIAGEALQSAANAAMDVVADQTRSIFPAAKKKEKDDRPLADAVRH
jgi:hypothetical protein